MASTLCGILLFIKFGNSNEIIGTLLIVFNTNPFFRASIKFSGSTKLKNKLSNAEKVASLNKQIEKVKAQLNELENQLAELEAQND